MGKISSLGVPRLRAITCGVIAAPHDSFDIEGVDVQDRLPLQTTQENHMPTYPIPTLASAPEKSKPALEQLQQSFGAGDPDRPADRRSRELLRVRGGVPHRAGPQSRSEF